MTPKQAAERERRWLKRLALEDAAVGRVVWHNYRFECAHVILTGPTRRAFMEIMARVKNSYLVPDEPSAFLLYKDTIRQDRALWMGGERVSVPRPLVMVKHGEIVYRECWSFLSGLPDDPDDMTIRSALGGESSGQDGPSRDAMRLRTAAAIQRRLREPGPWREHVNAELVAAGLSALTDQEAGSVDSHRRYHDHMVMGGYIPIWWVTARAALSAALDDPNIGPDMPRGARAAVALGLSGARRGPYYSVEIPKDDAVEYDVRKPTTLSGGYPDNFCAVATAQHPGATARLDDGEVGLVEAVMAPIAPFRDGAPVAWPPLDYLGPISEPVPLAKTTRIRQRLSVPPPPVAPLS